jgi:hypothetical protein
VVVWKRAKNGFDVSGLFSLVVERESKKERVVCYQGDFRESEERSTSRRDEPSCLTRGGRKKMVYFVGLDLGERWTD